ncbi:MAG: Smr/MutS family protein [Fibrobacteria bacterium]
MGRKRSKSPGGNGGERIGSGYSGRVLPLEVEEELDLHGLAIDEAMAQVELALARWRKHAGACLRIIHGRSSGNENSIKGSLRRNLETKWKGKVGSFRPELGNPGATLVFLPASAARNT